jgi:hypothetical protein
VEGFKHLAPSLLDEAISVSDFREQCVQLDNLEERVHEHSTSNQNSHHDIGNLPWVYPV